MRLYNINQEVLQDIDKLNNFVQSWNSDRTLIIQRPRVKQIPSILNIFSLLLFSSVLIFPILISIAAIFIYPIITYTFDLQKNTLILQKLIFFSVKETSYSLNELVITSSIENKEEKQPSISIKLEREKTHIINDFKNKAEALNLLN